MQHLIENRFKTMRDEKDTLKMMLSNIPEPPPPGENRGGSLDSSIAEELIKLNVALNKEREKYNMKELELEKTKEEIEFLKAQVIIN